MMYFCFSKSSYDYLLGLKLESIKTKHYDGNNIQELVHNQIKIRGSTQFVDVIQKELGIIASTASGRSLIHKIFKEKKIELLIKESPEKRNHLVWKEGNTVSLTHEIQLAIPDCKRWYKTILTDFDACSLEEEAFTAVIFHEMCHLLHSIQDFQNMNDRLWNNLVPQKSQTNQEEYLTMIGFDLARDKKIFDDLDFQDCNDYDNKFVSLISLCENLFLKEIGKPCRCDHTGISTPADQKAPLFSDLCLAAVEGEVQKRLKGEENESINQPQKTLSLPSYKDKKLLPISYAVLSQDSSIVSLVLDSSQIDKLATDDVNGPLHLCIQKGDVENFRLLVEKGWDLGTLDSKGRTPLRAIIEDYCWESALSSEWIEMAVILINTGRAQYLFGSDGKADADILEEAMAKINEAISNGMSREEANDLPLASFLIALNDCLAG